MRTFEIDNLTLCRRFYFAANRNDLTFANEHLAIFNELSGAGMKLTINKERADHRFFVGPINRESALSEIDLREAKQTEG